MSRLNAIAGYGLTVALLLGSVVATEPAEAPTYPALRDAFVSPDLSRAVSSVSHTAPGSARKILVEVWIGGGGVVVNTGVIPLEPPPPQPATMAATRNRNATAFIVGNIRREAKPRCDITAARISVTGALYHGHRYLTLDQ